MLFRNFPAGHVPLSVAERLKAISANNAQHFGFLIAEFWEADRARDYERADRLSRQMAPYLELAPANPIAGIFGGVGGSISVNEVQFSTVQGDGWSG